MSHLPPPNDQEFYVGYFPVPARLRRSLRMLVPAILWLLCGVSALWAFSQHAPPPVAGEALWDTSKPVQLTGLLIARPYPALLVPREAGHPPETVLVIEVGKHGGQARAHARAERAVTLSGWVLQRDGRRMLELEPGDAAITDAPASFVMPDPTAAASALANAPSSPAATLRGEIVDSKCYHGAMKPGHGKAHKECATLCVKGGIPPMLVTRSPDGSAVAYLIQGPGGEPMDHDLLPLIADPVEVRGDLSMLGDLPVLTLRPEDVRRP